MRQELETLYAEVRQDVPDIVTPIGNDQANIMIIASSPDPGETEMFAGPNSKIYRRLMVEAGMNATYAYCTYLWKVPLREYRPISLWRDMVMREIAIVKPRAIVFFGHEAINTLFARRHDDLRLKRINHRPLPDHTMFITHDWNAICANREAQKTREQEFVGDMLSIVHVDELHFPETITL